MQSSRIVNLPQQSIPQTGTAHRQRTISTTSIDLVNWTLAAGTTHVLVQFNNADARVTFDGTTDPTATKGYRYTDGTSALWSVDMVSEAKCIREAATDVIAEIQELNYRAT